MTIARVCLLMLVLTGLLLVRPVGAQVDPKARAIFESAGKVIQQAGQLYAAINTTQTIELDGITRKTVYNMHVWKEAPEKLASILRGEKFTSAFYNNAESRTYYIANNNQYSVGPPVGKVDAIMPVAAGQAGPIAVAALQQEGLNQLLQQLKGAKYIAPAKVGGVRAHHISIEAARGSGDLWISDTTQPLILHAVVNVQIPRPIKYENSFRWSINRPIAEQAFVFNPPPGSRAVAVDQPKSTPSTGAVASGATPSGKPAPNFVLTDMNGQTVELAKRRGKVVVLDFFATWCGPCRQAMPGLVEVTSKYSAHGVELYAVNLREDLSQVRKMFQQMNLNIPVLLDLQGQVASAYGVSGIPHTVVIGKDGSILNTQSGFGPATKAQMESVLQQAIR